MRTRALKYKRRVRRSYRGGKNMNKKSKKCNWFSSIQNDDVDEEKPNSIVKNVTIVEKKAIPIPVITNVKIFRNGKIVEENPNPNPVITNVKILRNGKIVEEKPTQVVQTSKSANNASKKSNSFTKRLSKLRNMTPNPLSMLSSNKSMTPNPLSMLSSKKSIMANPISMLSSKKSK